MKKILFFLLLPVFIVYGQSKDRVFRIAFESKDAVGYSYGVNVLKLSADNAEYHLIEQKYISKRFARKNIPSKCLITNGKWSIQNDTLKLVDNETKKEMLFIIKSNYLIFLFNNEEPTKSHWTEID